MIQRFIIALLICGVLWGVIRQQNHVSAGLKPENKINITKIDAKEIKSTAMPGKKFIPHGNAQPKEAVEVDHAMTSSINFTRDDNKSIPVTANAYNAQTKTHLSPEAVWSGRRFIITTTVKNHSEIEQQKILPSPVESKQQNPSEPESDTPHKPDKVSCPLVEKIQKTAQQINDSFLYEGTYRIVSYEPVVQYNDVSWLVGVRGIVAGSSDEAIYMASIAISETNHHKNEYAEMLDGQAFSLSTPLLVCYYGSGDIIALGIRDKMPVEE